MSAICIFGCFLLSLVFMVGGEYVYSPDGKCTIDGVNGICVNIGNCPSALKDLQNKKNPQICSFKGTDPIVCCKDSDKKADILRSNGGNMCEPRPPIITEYYPLKRCVQYRENLLLQCKYQNTTGRWEYKDLCQFPGDFFIAGAGGNSALRNDFRHMALLLYGAATSLDIFCGGSVLSERYILTAAHCSSSSTLGPVTIAVTGILKISDPEELWRRNKIQSVIVHPEYESPQKYHDIALLKTLDEIKLDDIVVPICLHTGSERVDDSDVFATGWGALGHRQPFADNLQTIPLRKNDNCSQVYGPQRLLMRGFDNETQVCYGDDGQIRDTCQGDSGGPVQVSIGRCLYSVVAVTSFGKQCATAGVPAVYTRVQHYWRWAADIVWPDHTL